MKDPIERQTAINALGERPSVYFGSAYEIAQRNQYDSDKLAIETVPPAQPEPCEDTVSREAAIDIFDDYNVSVENGDLEAYSRDRKRLCELPSAQPEIVRCKDCKHNPKLEWFGCPMSHLNEKQRPETAWCWKGEMRNDD